MSVHPDVPLASDALLRPVRPGNPFEDTVERLLQTIRLGVLQPGESLPPERELAARHWTYVQDYADAKGEVVEGIIARALADDERARS